MKQVSSFDPIGSEPQTSPKRELPKFKMALRALHYRNYRLFFGGQLVSLVGTWMQMVAQSWLVYRLTGSSLMLGSIGFASQIPVFLLAFVGGTVADRYSRHRIVIGTQSASMILALVLAVVTLSDVVRVEHIFVLSALLGTVNAFDMPARQAFIVELVDREDLINAIALNSSVFNGARVIGPAVAGMLVASIGEGWCFFANGISFIAVIAGLLLMRIKPQRGDVGGRSSALSNVLEGFRFVRGARPIRALLFLLGLVSVMGMPYSVLMPIFADKILHGGARGLGILMGATGFGALAGSMFIAARSGTGGLGKLIGYACAGFGTSLALFSISQYFWLSVLFLFPAGFSLMVLMASTNTLIQTMVPDRLRGRVMAMHVMMFMGMAPFGSLLSGAIAEHAGAPVTIFLGAASCLIGSGVFLWRLPGLQLTPYSYVRTHMDDAESM